MRLWSLLCAVCLYFCVLKLPLCGTGVRACASLAVVPETRGRSAPCLGACPPDCRGLGPHTLVCLLLFV